jgi:hypothetical protein
VFDLSIHVGPELLGERHVHRRHTVETTDLMTKSAIRCSGPRPLPSGR